VEIIRPHDWQVSPGRAIEIQRGLAAMVSKSGDVIEPRLIAGVDVSVDKAGSGTGAVVVLSYPGFDVVETQVVTARVEFPYIPGLLSFRELPLLLAAFENIKMKPGLVMVDGQGIAHPRRMGLASHLGLSLGVPTIGCAKSRLCGDYEMPGIKAASYTDLTDRDEVIGAVLRTRDGVNPVYVSIGHRISLHQAVQWVLRCCRGYRLPEPTRLAHQAAGGNLKAVMKAVISGAGHR
jgi:deoxyribonuclease V